MNRADATAVRRAAAAAFGVVLALCVLLALLLWPPTGAARASAPFIVSALGLAAVVGLLGGGGLGWTLSKRGWVPPPLAPPREASPVPAAEDLLRERAKVSGRIAGIVSGLFLSPFVFLAIALMFGALSVEGRSLVDAVLLTVLLSAVLGTLVGVSVSRSLLRRPVRADPRGLADLPPQVRKEALLAVRRGRTTGDPAVDTAAQSIAAAFVRARVPGLRIGSLGPFLVLFLPSSLSFVERGHPLAFLGWMSLALVGLAVLGTVGETILVLRRRSRGRAFLRGVSDVEEPQGGSRSTSM